MRLIKEFLKRKDLRFFILIRILRYAVTFLTPTTAPIIIYMYNHSSVLKFFYLTLQIIICIQFLTRFLTVRGIIEQKRKNKNLIIKN